MNPDKAPQGDPSIGEFLQIMNNITYIPEQADLADKGKTPFRAKLVLATTNTKDFNAHHYFSCPSAAQRRFPYIVQPVVKPEFRQKDCMSLDTSKTFVREGEYSDYWTWSVFKITPRPLNQKRYLANETKILDNVDLKTFLKWYGNAIDEHLRSQAGMKKAIDNHSSIKNCFNCHLPTYMCDCELQFGDQGWHHMFNRAAMTFNSFSFMRKVFAFLLLACYFSPPIIIFIMWIIGYILAFVFTFSTLVVMTMDWRTYVNVTYYLHPIRIVQFLIRLFLPTWRREDILWWIPTELCLGVLKFFGYVSPNSREYWEQLGFRVQNRMYNAPNWVKTLGSAVVAAALAYKIKSFMSTIQKNQKHVYIIPKDKYKKTEKGYEFVPQGGEQSTSKPPQTTKQERENVWFKDNYELSNYDLTDVITSSKSLNFESFINLVVKNCCVFRAGKYNNRGFCLKGHIYLLNKHFANLIEDMSVVTIQFQGSTSGISSTTPFVFEKSRIKFVPNSDLCLIRIANLPPRKDLTGYLPKESLSGVHKGISLGINFDGSLYKNCFDRSSKYLQCTITQLDEKIDVWEKTGTFPSQRGDCGSITILNTSSGYVLAGIHVCGKDNTLICNAISNKLLDYTKDFPSSDIQSGRANFNDVEGYVVPLSGTLHYKSPVRYIEQGHADVIDSSLGFRTKNKSRVEKTLIFDSMVKRGFEEKYTSPEMNSYKPWRIALIDMVDPVYKYSEDLLDMCKKSYLDKILTNLDPCEFDLLHPYDDFTVINGAAGITFVDKINRNTSMGNPWKKSKKYFISEGEPTQLNPDPVIFDESVMSRVRDIEESYKRGEVCHANFCAHLKDEPVTFKKKEMGKTRVFAGAPVDFTIVVRKYLLSAIRVIQRNTHIFEAAPGTIAQSKEWGDIYRYVTHFGENKIVAGDYKSFDKRMPPAFMLAAFDILESLCRLSGNYDEDDLRVIRCIAQDTCYPFMDYHGDFIKFHGSNPSGHPLTVIINSIVNSLYVRYAYIYNNPEHECLSFNDNVHLMTYGDDNIMGISDNIPWFNHTTIQHALASMGITYTMADKEAQSIPYIHIKDASFLKRTWRYEKEFKDYACPLDEDSIIKMLMICVRSKTITPEFQIMESIKSAVMEYFWYGKITFEEKKKMLLEIVKENDLESYIQDSTFPTWKQLVKDWKRYSRGGKMEREEHYEKKYNYELQSGNEFRQIIDQGHFVIDNNIVYSSPIRVQQEIDMFTWTYVVSPMLSIWCTFYIVYFTSTFKKTDGFLTVFCYLRLLNTMCHYQLYYLPFYFIPRANIFIIKIFAIVVETARYIESYGRKILEKRRLRKMALAIKSQPKYSSTFRSVQRENSDPLVRESVRNVAKNHQGVPQSPYLGKRMVEPQNGPDRISKNESSTGSK
jgi:hypothetical protein